MMSNVSGETKNLIHCSFYAKGYLLNERESESVGHEAICFKSSDSFHFLRTDIDAYP